jgi:hypothetical protein
MMLNVHVLTINYTNIFQLYILTLNSNNKLQLYVVKYIKMINSNFILYRYWLTNLLVTMPILNKIKMGVVNSFDVKKFPLCQGDYSI